MIIKRIRNWLWWKAYGWVFGVKYDYRWMAVHDRLNAEWLDGYFAGVRSTGKEINE